MSQFHFSGDPVHGNRVSAQGLATAQHARGDLVIRHTVMFRLRHPKGSAEETDFLSAAKVLAQIPGVRQFEPPRVSRRLQLLRGRGHDEQDNDIFP